MLVGLSARRALQSPALSERRSALVRERLGADERLAAGMAVGAVLARTGELQRRARRAQRERPPAVQRERQLTASGARLGRARAEAFQARRDAKARSLGFAGLEAYYRRRHREDRARLERMAGELGCAVSAVRATSPASGSARNAAARTVRVGEPSAEPATPSRPLLPSTVAASAGDDGRRGCAAIVRPRTSVTSRPRLPGRFPGERGRQ